MSRSLQFELDGPPTPVDLSELTAMLQDLAGACSTDPVVAHLSHPNETSLAFGLGEEVSFLSWVAADGDPPYYVTQGQYDGDERELIWTDEDGQGIDYPPSYWIDWDDALVAIIEYATTGQRPMTVTWQEP